MGLREWVRPSKTNRSLRDRARMGWRLTRRSLVVFVRTPRLVVFPVTAAVGTLAVAGATLLPALEIASRAVASVLGLSPTGAGQAPTAYLMVFWIWMVTVAVTATTNAGLVYCVDRELDGESSSVLTGMVAALQSLPTLLIHAVVMAAAGTILKGLERRLGLRLVTAVAGAALALLTVFVVPVAVLEEDADPRSVYSRSAALFGRTWGETTVVRLGTTMVAMLPVTVALAVVYALLFFDALVLGTGTAEALLEETWFLWAFSASVGVSLLVANTVTTVAKVGLYRYACERDPVLFDDRTAETAPGTVDRRVDGTTNPP